MSQSRSPRARYDVWLRYPDGERHRLRTVLLRDGDLSAVQQRWSERIAKRWQVEQLRGPVPAVEVQEAPPRWFRLTEREQGGR